MNIELKDYEGTGRVVTVPDNLKAAMLVEFAGDEVLVGFDGLGMQSVWADSSDTRMEDRMSGGIVELVCLNGQWDEGFLEEHRIG